MSPEPPPAALRLATTLYLADWRRQMATLYTDVRQLARTDPVAALGRLSQLDRGTVRKAFEERFTASRMARDYVRVYEQLIGDVSTPPESAASAV